MVPLGDLLALADARPAVAAALAALEHVDLAHALLVEVRRVDARHGVDDAAAAAQRSTC